MKKKSNLVIVSGIGVVMLLLFLGSFVSPLLVYMSILLLNALVLMNVIRIDEIKIKVETKPEEEPKDEEPKPTEVKEPKVKEIIKEEKKPEEIRDDLSKKEIDEIIPSEEKEEPQVSPEIIEKANKVVSYIKGNLEKGHDINKIYKALVSSGWEEEFLQRVMIEMGIIKVKEPELPKIEQEKKTKKKSKKKKDPEYKAEIVDPEHMK